MNGYGISEANEEQTFPSVKDIFRAREVLGQSVRKTPLQRSVTFSKLIGSNIFLKLESLQLTGSFKVRGALAKLNTLSEEERKYGVVARFSWQPCTRSCLCRSKEEHFVHNCYASECLTS